MYRETDNADLQLYSIREIGHNRQLAVLVSPPPAPPGEKGKVPLPLLAQLSLLSAFGLRMTPFIKMSLRTDTFYALRIVSAIWMYK